MVILQEAPVKVNGGAGVQLQVTLSGKHTPCPLQKSPLLKQGRLKPGGGGGTQHVVALVPGGFVEHVQTPVWAWQIPFPQQD